MVIPLQSSSRRRHPQRDRLKESESKNCSFLAIPSGNIIIITPIMSPVCGLTHCRVNKGEAGRRS